MKKLFTLLVLSALMLNTNPFLKSKYVKNTHPEYPSIENIKHIQIYKKNNINDLVEWK